MNDDITITVEQGSDLALDSASVVDVALDQGQEITIEAGTAQGPQGLDGGVTLVRAAENLGGDRAITIDGRYCDGTSLNNLAKYVGITLGATTTGNNVQIKRTGAHTIVGATFTVDMPVYIGPDGTLTQTLPANPIRRIGWASATDTINLDPFPIIGA